MSFIHFFHSISNNLHIWYISREWTFLINHHILYYLHFWILLTFIFCFISKFITTSIQLIIQFIFTLLVLSLSHSLCTLILWKNFRNGKMKLNAGCLNLLFITLPIIVWGKFPLNYAKPLEKYHLDQNSHQSNVQINQLFLPRIPGINLTLRSLKGKNQRMI